MAFLLILKVKDSQNLFLPITPEGFIIKPRSRKVKGN